MADKKEKNLATKVGYQTSSVLRSIDQTQRSISKQRNPRDAERNQISSSDINNLRKNSNYEKEVASTLSYDAVEARKTTEPTVQVRTEEMRHDEVVRNMQRPVESTTHAESPIHINDARVSVRSDERKPNYPSSDAPKSRENVNGYSMATKTRDVQPSPRLATQVETKKNSDDSYPSSSIRRNEYKETVSVVTEDMKRQEDVQRIQSSPTETISTQPTRKIGRPSDTTNVQSTPKLATQVRTDAPKNIENQTRNVGTIQQKTHTETIHIVTEDMKHQEVANRIQKPTHVGLAMVSNVENQGPNSTLHGSTVAVQDNKGLKTLAKEDVQTNVSTSTVPGTTIQIHNVNATSENGPINGPKGKNLVGLKTSTGTSVSEETTNLQSLSKNIQNGTFYTKEDPSKILQTRVENTSKGTFKIDGEDFAGNSNLEIENIQKMLNKKKYSDLLTEDTKLELLTALRKGEVSAMDVRKMLMSAKTANRSGIYLKNADGTIRTLSQVRAMGAANRMIGGKGAGVTKLSKGTSVGLQGAAKLARTSAVVGRFAGNMTKAAQKGIDDPIDSYVDVGVNKAKELAALKAQKEFRKVAWKGSKKAGKYGFKATKWLGKTLTKAIQVTIGLIKSLIVKLIAVIGPSFFTIILPLILALVMITAIMTVFLGSDASKEAYNTLFAAETVEFQTRRQDKLSAMEARKQSPPSMDDFEGVTEEEYMGIISSQWIPDTVTTDGNSDIDFKAQLTHFQILSNAMELSDKSIRSDFLTIVRYWDEQKIIESYSESTQSYPYTIEWTARKELEVEETAEAKTKNAAFEAAKEKALANVKDGYTATNPDDIEILESYKIYKNVPVLDSEGKETGEVKKVLDRWEITVGATLKLEKSMTKDMTQYIYTLHIKNGNYDDYVRVSQDAYRNNVELTVSNYSLGQEGFGTTVSTDGSQKKNMEAIWGFLKKNGFTDEAAAGVMGNIQAESHFDPGAIEGNGEGHGIVQWSFGRKTKLFQMAAARGVPWSDMGVQLDLLLQEFNAYSYFPYFSSPEEFKRCTDIRKTTEAFMICFERPAVQSEAAIRGRTNNSKSVYNQLKGKTLENSHSSTRVVWIGDSRTEGMKQAVSSNGKDVWIAKVAEGYNWFVNHAITEASTKIRPGDTVVINLGVNDLHNVDRYIKKFNELAEGPWKNIKEFKVMSVNPIDESKWSSLKNSQIEEFNRRMKAGLCKKIKYVDAYSKLKGKIETTDGLHYAETTYRKIYQMIRGNENGTTSYGTKIEVDPTSKHFNKTYYYEELISQQFLVHREPSRTETESPKPNQSQTNPNSKKQTGSKPNKKPQNNFVSIDKTEIDEDTLAQMKTLYQSEFLMEGFDFQNLSYGVSGFESFGFDGAIQDPIKEENSTSMNYGQMSVPGNPFEVPQCTWFAWARFYQVYGYDSGARGHGMYNAQQIVASHPDKFQMSSTPAPGSVFSIYSGPSIFPQYGHVGFVEAVEGDTMWISEGNVTLNGTPGVMWFHKVSISDWHSKYRIEYAVPIHDKK